MAELPTLHPDAAEVRRWRLREHRRGARPRAPSEWDAAFLALAWGALTPIVLVAWVFAIDPLYGEPNAASRTIAALLTPAVVALVPLAVLPTLLAVPLLAFLDGVLAIWTTVFVVQNVAVFYWIISRWQRSRWERRVDRWSRGERARAMRTRPGRTSQGRGRPGR